ncbi:hypothetical protein [Bradyrhizobium japonicum]|uniref:hypothetical protein n=1 Tax=Bradyrhizobium japonicum TaxID=375 RepID=UPI001E4D7F0C|nr:hypothetical protein [Bradyrhizobium japonicum]MCD9891598.1 hypothetical protein [Bradyrhizobium japonicum]WRJ80983.1 hypothetical protein R3F78_33710 [Bradyrhizobium japonicum]WRJ89588.1 hypothetical protein R3F77_29295 [Bradyrhizobium japonicum]WRK50089.1 hypothetical protein R3F73_18865 [Bradyrhizobium japonicum]
MRFAGMGHHRLDYPCQSKIMSQPLLSPQTKHGDTQATATADETDFRSAIAMALIAPLPKVIAPATVSRRDDLSPPDATTIAFERLGLVIAIEGQPRRSSSISRCNPARDTGWLRVEIPWQRAAMTAPSPSYS